MIAIEDATAFLDRFAPPRLAEEWDNVGLLVGDAGGEVRRVMTCLTVTPTTAAEAVERRVDLLVTHHPMPFRPLKRLTAETTVGRLLLELIAARIAVYSPHTAFDSAEQGINQQLAEGLALKDIAPLIADEEGQGTGRFGRLDSTLGELAGALKQFLGIERAQIVGESQQPVASVAVACGAAGELLDAARAAGCDAMVLGETHLHTCLEAEAAGVGLVLPGHFASERFAVERLADVLAAEFPQLEIWPSRTERDPLRWV